MFLKGSFATSCTCKGSLSSTFTSLAPNCQSEPLRCDSISGKKKDEKKRERESPPSLSSARSWRSLERPPTCESYSRYRIKLVLSGRSCNPSCERSSLFPFPPAPEQHWRANCFLPPRPESSSPACARLCHPRTAARLLHRAYSTTAGSAPLGRLSARRPAQRQHCSR